MSTAEHHTSPVDLLAEGIRLMGDGEDVRVRAGTIRRALQQFYETMAINETLESICEHMATEHIAFGVVGSDEKVHPDWCVQCVFDKLREAIAERTQWAHEHSHGTDVHPDWRDCPMPTCFEARGLIATKLPFSEADDAPTD